MNSNEIWIALISAGSTFITALGLNKIVPAIIKWWEEKSEEKRQRRAASVEAMKKLTERLNFLEKELDKRVAFEVQTRSTLNAMIPLMKEMMKEHPNFVKVLEQLEKNIIGNKTPAEGENID